MSLKRKRAPDLVFKPEDIHNIIQYPFAQGIRQTMPLDAEKPGEFYDTGKLFAKLSGSPFEIGLKHGQVAKDLIKRAIEIYSKLYLDSKNVSWELARSRAEKFEEPTKAKYPEIWEELEGIAKGSGRDVLDILALNVRSEITLVEISDGCTSIAQRNTKTGEVFVGQNWDWVPEIDEVTLFLEIKQEGKPTILTLAEAGIVSKYGFNSEGLGVMLNAIPSNRVDPDGLPVHFALRKALEQRTVAEALEYLDNNKAASAANLLLADPTQYLTLEISPVGNIRINPDEHTGAVLHTNHFLSKDLQKEIGTDKPILSSNSRFDRINVLTTPDLEANYESFRYRLSDLDNAPNSICSLVKEAKGLGAACTLYTIIVDTGKKEGIITLGPPSDQSLRKYKLYFD